MRVRMVADRTGGRYDGQDWPVPPGEFDVPDGEAAHLIGCGDAVPAPEVAKVDAILGTGKKTPPKPAPPKPAPVPAAPKEG